jgi:hypothetical protein
MNRKLRSNIAFFRALSVFLATLILYSALYPGYSWALTGGPSQPEVQSFEPVGTSDMVDVFSGDFNYNIPLLDVDGYPINISYHSGITMDQEASWVGLGWNINPGVINRNMRGLPDDFSGETIKKEFNMKPNKTYGVITGLGVEIVGLSDLIGLGVDYSLTFKYNNYKGFSIDKSLNLSLSVGKESGASGTASLGLTSSNDEGLTIQPGLSFDYKMQSADKSQKAGMGLKVGLSINSRSGLQSLTINPNCNMSASWKHKNKKGKDRSGSTKQSSGMTASFDFGAPTYIPNIGMSMKNYSIYGVFDLGGELFGGYFSGKLGGFYSKQSLANTTEERPAYGYMYSHLAGQNKDALMDFNREKDGVYTRVPKNLPLTNFTYDIYSVCGQGVGGSYRPMRNDVGYVYDPVSTSSNDDYSLAVEVGVGNLVEVGGNLGVTIVDSKTESWTDGNFAIGTLQFRGNTNDPLYEPYYFKEAGEMVVDQNPDFLNNIGGYSPVSLKINDEDSKTAYLTNQFNEGGQLSPLNYKTKRDIRNQAISVVHYANYEKWAVQPNLNDKIYSTANGNHIAEITTLRTDGARYVFGLPAYNTTQKQVTFAVGTTKSNQNGRPGDLSTGLVTYVPGDNTVSGNVCGLDNYVSIETMPAFAHSYLLTSVLSADYVDADKIPGPSDGDIGSYTRFAYKKLNNYKWRVPAGLNSANYDEGLKSLYNDDKANYIYGEKELYFLDSIVTKNYVAVFVTEDTRQDACGVTDEEGSIAATSGNLLLSKISLYSKRDIKMNGTGAIPIKEVHFEYDYSLCPGTPNSHAGGKLTLKKIYFTYMNSFKGRLSPYVFVYDSTNPVYNMKGYDRWGNYKPNPQVASSDPLDVLINPLTTSEYPYVDQDTATANQYVQAWTLTGIRLPSGGLINVKYESDDYAYVQDKPANQMFKIVGISPDDNSFNPIDIYDTTQINYNSRMWIKLDEADAGNIGKTAFFNKYISGLEYIYFRFLMRIKEGTGKSAYDYVSGYVSTSEISDYGIGTGANTGYAWILFKSVKINDSGGADVSPIVKAAIEFGRLYLADLVWNDDNYDPTGDSEPNFGIDLIKAICGASMVESIVEAIEGPNGTLYHKHIGTSAVLNKSWVRLKNPDKKMLGGGLRVKRIEMYDNWKTMTQEAEPEMTYGQEYSYTLEDGTSSGVAAYEPMIGGDENAMRKPTYTTEKHILAPDEVSYMEEPFGESFFPSPSVGYSRVVVKNLARTDVKNHATGYVVQEFYTARDFPTITARTDIQDSRAKSNCNFINNLLSIKVFDYYYLSEGYVVELNDMHGKVKSQKVYQEGIPSPISSIEYRYKASPYLNGSFRLNNNATVISADGTINNNGVLGVVYDFVADMRQSNTETYAAGLDINLNTFMCPIPIPIPTFFPTLTREEKRFRSASTTKVIQRFGILEETIATQDGSVVSTKNLAYNAETGDVLLTQTTTDFNDQIYSLSIPAYWYYDGMGLAYENLGIWKEMTFSGGTATVANADRYYVPGDELGIFQGPPVGGDYRLWVTEVTPSSISVMAKDGSTISGTKLTKILRSGRRNQQSTMMTSITSYANPLSTFSQNLYQNVVQANAVEYSNTWRTYCECFESDAGNLFQTMNPYVAGIKGFWRPIRSYLHLTSRTQSNENNNLNIREDGMMTSFTPFYKLIGSKWDKDVKNWTYASEITEFNPYGQELENRDALGRYSSAVFGYNQSLPIAVAANSMYKEVGFDNFEDYGFSPCADNHFKFRSVSPPHVITGEVAHSGKYCLKITGNNFSLISKQLSACALNECTIDLVPYGTPVTQINIMYGTGPYSIDWTIMVGNPSISLNDNGNGIDIVANGEYSIEIIATDINNCRVIKTFNNFN